MFFPRDSTDLDADDLVEVGETACVPKICPMLLRLHGHLILTCRPVFLRVCPSRQLICHKVRIMCLSTCNDLRCVPILYHPVDGNLARNPVVVLELVF